MTRDDLKEGNIVLFRKEDKELDSPWSLGKIEQLDVGRDGLSRNAVVKYQNASENFARFTDRSVRSLVKIWDIEDQNVDQDLGKLEAKLRNSFDCAKALKNVRRGIVPSLIVLEKSKIGTLKRRDLLL